MLKESDALHDKLVENVEYFREKMIAAGFDIKPTRSAICAVMLYDAPLSQVFAKKLLEEGIYVTGFYYPVVPKGQARIRVQVSAGHSRENLDKCVTAFVKVGKDSEIAREIVPSRATVQRIIPARTGGNDFYNHYPRAADRHPGCRRLRRRAPIQDKLAMAIAVSMPSIARSCSILSEMRACRFWRSPASAASPEQPSTSVSASSMPWASSSDRDWKSTPRSWASTSVR